MKHLVLCVILALTPFGAALADDFTFKRVKPPEAGSTAKRITVQITAPLPPSPPIAVTPQAPTPSGSTAQAWFWDVVSPALEPPEDGKFTMATTHVARSGPDAGIRPPSVAVLHGIAQAHGADILLNSVGTRVSPALALAVIAVESAGRVDAVSSAGAQGLMQLIPATAERFGVTDASNPSQNIAGGVTYLNWLLSEFHGDPVLALAGYNAGEGAVRKHGGVPPFAETRAYVPKVLAAWNVAKTLCITPPELPSDGCVFNLGL